MEFEKAAEHPELTVSMTAITATGFFEHGELVVLSFSMVQNELNGLEEHR